MGSLLGRIVGLLTGAAALSGPALGEPSARETVLRFAERFLGAEAVARLSAPSPAAYESFALLEVDADTTPYPDGLWGKLLLDEMLNHSDKAVWLDWRYNVLTLIDDDDWNDQLGAVFAQYGVPRPTPEERAEILALAAERHGARPEVMMFPALQPLAEVRGHRLMLFDNDSDGLGLFMLPVGEASEWHLTHLGDVLIIDAAIGTVADPRRSGRMSVLAN
ncbi:hypothetical protein [Jannaschia marina]|uniref:hypothetical protein n=1 Tax=Jannaschia marina TaxID=2741674 RepID=UPI0015C73B16|nr:hypothetical protein [Jannaschia marina]